MIVLFSEEISSQVSPGLSISLCQVWHSHPAFPWTGLSNCAPLHAHAQACDPVQTSCLGSTACEFAPRLLHSYLPSQSWALVQECSGSIDQLPGRNKNHQITRCINLQRAELKGVLWAVRWLDRSVNTNPMYKVITCSLLRLHTLRHTHRHTIHKRIRIKSIQSANVWELVICLGLF